MGLERNCRMGNDVANLKEAVLTMVRLCRKLGEWEQLNTIATLLSKRRGQHSKAVSSMVQECVGWVEETPDLKTKDALLVALRDITDGKIFLERERAELSRALAAMKETAGDISGAQQVMHEVAVETYGALDKKEKAEFILEQIRLTLAKKDYVRALIQSRKISRKVLLGEDMQEIKVRFYRLMIEYNTHEQNCFELCCDYHSIYDTPNVKKDEAAWQEALKTSAAFLILSPYTNTQQDMLHRVALYTELKDPALSDTLALLKLFTTPEIIGWPLAMQASIEGLPALSSGGDSLKAKWMADLRSRVVQHNIRVISGYYKKIRIARLANLLGLEVNAAEQAISEMVSEGYLYAKIDRPAGVISFSRPVPAEEVLSEWNSNLSSLLQLVETTTHLINKEKMIAGKA